MNFIPKGQLTVILGNMFSGKTTTLLKLLFNEAAIGLKVLYINHDRDKRSDQPFSTHNPLYKQRLNEMSNVKLLSVKKITDVLSEIEKYDIIGIDESQFFDNLKEDVQFIVESLNKKVIVSGLSSDFKREKFGQILDLIPISDDIIHLKSYCKNCADKEPKIITEAIFTHIKSKTNKQIQIGGIDKYIPVCRLCYLELNSMV